ncbi:hypothetical protein ABK040_006560 [Willaertia magna]
MLHLVSDNIANNKTKEQTVESNTLHTDEELLKNNKKERLTTCKEVINRLHWDETLTDVLQNLSFIYKDRFEGNIKISYQEFLNSELKDDLPEHRIQTLIYRDVHVFWDKNERIDLTSNDEIYNLIGQYNNTTVPNIVNNVESKKKTKRTIVKVDMLNDKTELNYDSEDDYSEYYDEYDSKYGKYL